MHALMAAVLLGTAGLDALDAYAETQPPDGEPGKAEQCIRAGERHAIIGVDGGRQSTLAKQVLEGGDRRIFAD